jgi:hypothetical protein
MTDRLMFVGDHADRTAKGRPLDRGDVISASLIDPKDPQDKRLLDDGLLVNLTAEKKDALAAEAGQKEKKS